jgi:hypothetical protein
MTNGPIEFQLAASFDWETLVPVLFFILYGVAQFFGSKKKGDAAKEGEEAYDREEADMEERARRIREEIRRKIEERRKQQGKPAPQTVRPAAYDPNLPEQQQSQPRTYQPEPAPRPIPVPQPVDPIPVLPQESSLERKLHEQRILLQKTRKAKQEAREQAREIESAARQGRRRKKTAKVVEIAEDSLRQELLTGLRDPMSLRKAVLYREILDPPIGLR